MKAALVVAAAAALAAAVACGGDSGLPNDQRTAAIQSVASGAAIALRDGGPPLLLQWFSPEFRQRCSEAAFAQALLETNVDAQLALENLTLDVPAARAAQRVS